MVLMFVKLVIMIFVFSSAVLARVKAFRASSYSGSVFVLSDFLDLYYVFK